MTGYLTVYFCDKMTRQRTMALAHNKEFHLQVSKPSENGLKKRELFQDCSANTIPVSDVRMKQQPEHAFAKFDIISRHSNT